MTWRPEVPRRPWDREPLRSEDMHIRGDLFGIRREDDGILALYVEDDGWWHFKTAFNHYWITDLAGVLAEAAK